MKRGLSVVAILFFSVMVFGIGNPAQGAEVKPIELRIMHWGSTALFVHKDVFVPWVKMLEERTGGRVKGVIYPGELLGKAKDTYDLVIAGTADMGWSGPSMSPGRFPLHVVWDLPMLFPNGIVATRVMWEMFEKEPSLRAEFREVKVLWLHSFLPMAIHTVNKPVRSLEDLKGMKIRIGGGTLPPSSIKALGATPVVMPPPDVYTALERRTIEGVVTTFEAAKAFRFDEVTKYHTDAKLWGGEFYVVMNKKRWESFSPDIQKIIEGLSGTWAADLADKATEKAEIDAIEEMKRAGHEIITLSSEERGKWREKVRFQYDAWVADMEAKGLPGKKILDEVLRLVEKYSK